MGSESLSPSLVAELRWAHHPAIALVSGYGNCWENVVVDALSRTLENDLVPKRRLAIRPGGTLENFDYIKGSYDRTSRHRAVG